MPQLDVITYFYQFNWLLLSFGIFYIFTLKIVFPTIATTLKARTKKFLRDRKDLSNIETEEKNGLFVYETIWDSALRLKEKQISYIQALQYKFSVLQIRK